MEKIKTGIAPQQEDKRIKDFTNARHATINYACAGDLNFLVNLTPDTYLELVNYESFVITALDSTLNQQRTISGQLTQNGASKMTVFDPNTMTMDTVQPASDLILDLNNVNLTPSLHGRMSNEFLRGKYELQVLNHIGSSLGAFTLPLNSKIERPHIFFEYKNAQSLTFKILNASFSIDYPGVIADDLAMIIRFEFREYPTSIYYFRQEGRIYS